MPNDEKAFSTLLKQAEVFDEVSLYRDICRIWGAYGAHAEVMRYMMQRAGITIPAINPSSSKGDLH